MCRLWGSQISSGCCTPRDQPLLWLRGKPHSELPWLCEVAGVKAAFAKQVSERSRKSVDTGQSAAPKAQVVGPSAEQMDLGEGWNHFGRGGGRVVKFTTTPSTNSHPNPPPQSVTEAHEKPIVTATRETAKHKKPQFKTTSPSKRTSGMSNKKAEASVKTAAATPTIPSLVVHTLSPTSPLEEISDLLDHLPLHACVELTHRLLTSITSLPTETARPRAFMKTVILLYQNIAARRGRTELCKALRLACWNANGVSCRKLVLVHSLSQHGVDICLLIQPFLNPGQAFRFANYVCHRTDKSTAGGGTAILVRRGIVHHSVPVPGLTHLEATAIQVILDGKLV